MSLLRRTSRATLTALSTAGLLASRRCAALALVSVALTGCGAWVKPTPTLILTSVPECPVDPALREPIARPPKPDLKGLSPADALFVVLGFSLQQEATVSLSEGLTRQAVRTMDQCNANARALTKQIEESRQGWLRRVMPW